MFVYPQRQGVSMARNSNATASACSQLNLRGSRAKKGLSLEQIAETTKISMRFLKAIEDEEFDKLPGGIFNTSYLKQYAVAIGFDPAKLLSFYDRRTAPQQTAEVLMEPETRGLLRWFRVPV